MELTSTFARFTRAGNHGGADGHVGWVDWLDWFVSWVLDRGDADPKETVYLRNQTHFKLDFCILA
jgi:hypothetical protein